MTPLATKPTQGTRPAMPQLDDYLVAVRDANPFAVNRVNEPSTQDVDVPAIHAAGFDRLVALAGQVHRQRSGVGVAMLGAAGVGKSHLLSRLYRWANAPAEAGGPRACYVYVHNILADPDRMPRYLLKYTLSRLAEGRRGRLCETPLYRYVDQALRHALREAGLAADTIEDKFKEAVEAYRSYFGKRADDLTPYIVLLQFWRFARPEKADEPGRRTAAEAALGWLSGDEIDPGLAARLGLPTQADRPVMLADDQQVEQVLAALTQLAAASGQPFVLCIDQVENLDPDKLKPLARFLHALLDHSSNLLLITSAVKQTLLSYREENVIPEAAWDRIAQYKVDLRRVSRADARKILEARLERFHEPFLDVDEVRRRVHDDTLFPLGEPWLETQLGDGLDFRPRDVLTWARDAWEDRQAELAASPGLAWFEQRPKAVPSPSVPAPTPPKLDEVEAAVDGAVERRIAEQTAKHRQNPGSLPPDAGNLAGLVESLLSQCTGDALPYGLRGVERQTKSGPKLPPYDLLVRRRDGGGREVTTGILFITNEGLAATSALRRLLQDDRPPDLRLLVTDHERRPLKVGPQGVEYYKELEKLGREQFQHIKISFAQYALLDALRDAVGAARCGDLEVESPRGTTRAVSEAEVIASHHRKDRYRQHLLLRPVLASPASDPPSLPAARLDELDVRRYINGQLGWMMGSTARAIAQGYVETLKGQKPAHEAVWAQVKAIAGRMQADGLLHATPQDDDLFLLLRK